MKKLSMAIACGLILAGGAGAYAQEEPGDEMQPTVTRRSGTEHLRTPMGTSIQIGGGVTNFSSERTRDLTNVGGTWEARAVIGTRSFASLEVAYVGNAADITAPGLDPDAVILGNGAEANLRLQMPYSVSGVLLEPFAFGGLGWTRYNLVNDEFNTSVVSQTDHVATIPFGAGFATGYRGFIADARFTYRQVFDDELFPVASESGNSDLQNWAVGVTVGYEF